MNLNTATNRNINNDINNDINSNMNNDITNDMNTKIETYANRCIAITKNNKKCRAKINKDSFFCCPSHEPYNIDLFEKGCFMCMEKIEKSSEIIYFECKHLFHKPCYLEWLTYSTYEKPICLICRNDVIVNKDIHLNLQKYKKMDVELYKQIINIKNTFSNSTINNCNMNNCKQCTKTYVDKYVNTSLFCEKLLANKKN